jgi:hypothetical protein
VPFQREAKLPSSGVPNTQTFVLDDASSVLTSPRLLPGPCRRSVPVPARHPLRDRTALPGPADHGRGLRRHPQRRARARRRISPAEAWSANAAASPAVASAMALGTGY